jgi:hypothetical protein
MSTTSGDGPSFFARYIDGPKKERLEPEKILIGKDTVRQWMQLCIDADAIKLEETENPRAIKLGSDHKPAWVACLGLHRRGRPFVHGSERLPPAGGPHPT